MKNKSKEVLEIESKLKQALGKDKPKSISKTKCIMGDRQDKRLGTQFCLECLAVRLYGSVQSARDAVCFFQCKCINAKEITSKNIETNLIGMKIENE